MAEVVPGLRHDRRALILFGSETGNSEDVAECLGQVVERLHFLSKVCEMNEVDLNVLSKATVVIFVISTTGQGEFPKNARKFWKSLLRKRLPPGCLSHVSFTTFGLGDSSYVQFNWAVRKLHKRLQQLGAQEIYPRGEADEQHNEGIDGTYLSWSADFGRHLLSLYPLPEGLVPIPPEIFLLPKYYLTLAGRKKEKRKTETSDSSALAKIKDLDSVKGSLVVADTKTGEARDKINSGSFLEQATTTQPQPSSATTATPLEATTPDPTSNLSGVSTILDATANPSGLLDSLTIDSVAKPPLHAKTANAKGPATSAHQSSISDELPTSTPNFHQPPPINGSIINPVTIASGSSAQSVANMYRVDDTYCGFFPPRMEDEPIPCNQLKEAASGQPESRDPFISNDIKVPFPDAISVQVLSNMRMTPTNHWQDVRQITLAVPEKLDPRPGDVLTLYPRNFEEDVDKLIELMGWADVENEEIIFEARYPDWLSAEMLVTKPRGLHPVPNSTLRDLLTYNLDITAIPNRLFFQFIAFHTEDLAHRERLFEFTNPAYTDEFFDYAARPRRSIIEVLQDFPSVKIPWKFAVRMFPVIRGRKYSICNGGHRTMLPPGQHPGMVKVQILVAIVKYRTVLHKIRQGLCSRYVSQLHRGYMVDIVMEDPGTFGGPEQYHPKKPLILIGPGTGVAPLRSLIWERACKPLKNENKRADTLLFYGGRNRNADYFYADEWYTLREYVSTFTAFSRDQKEKIYVQDIIRQQGKIVWEMIAEGANIYICGSSGAMPKAVRAAIADVMEEWGNFKDREEVEQTLAGMQKKGGRYIEEVW